MGGTGRGSWVAFGAGRRTSARIAVAALVAAATIAPAAASPEVPRNRPAGGVTAAQAGTPEPLHPPAEITPGGAFGSAVDLSADGHVAVVGAPLDGSGSATVYLDSGNGWIEVTRLTDPTGQPGDQLGASVAVDGDGTVVAIGAPGADGGAGTVLVFFGPEWSSDDAQVLTTPGAAAFGASVDLDAAGDTLLVGSPGGTGTAWSYQGPDFTADPPQGLAHPGTPGDGFGHAVAVSADGSTAAVGSPAWGIAGDDGGAVFVYPGPNLPEPLTARPPGTVTGDGVGTAVALDADGATLLVGAPGSAGGAGAAWRFTGSDGYASGTAASLPIEAAPGDGLGTAVALSGAGTTALVGAPGAPVVYLVHGIPDLAEGEAEVLPPGPHGGALALGGGGPLCLTGTTSPGAGPAAVAPAGVVPGSAGAAVFCRIGGNVAGTVLAEIDPDPPEGGEPFREVMVSIYVVVGGQRGPRLFVPQWLDVNGRFAFQVPPGTYEVVARPAPWYFSVGEASQEVVVPPGDTTMELLLPKVPLPPGGTLIEPALPSAQPGVLEVPAGAEPAVAFQACPGGSGTWEVVRRSGAATGAGLVRGELTESGQYPGRYTARIPRFADEVEEVAVLFRVVCPDGSVESGRLDTFIDPSGIVRDLFGDPVQGAQVVLRRSDSASGPFVTVADGSSVMSPANRANPTVTDEAGFYRWDVVAGFYVVRASAPGCHAPGDPARPHVDSAVLPVPPPQVDVDLVLDCGSPQPLTVRGTPRACPPDVPPAGFADVPPSNVHGASVSCITWWGVAQGVDATRFAPSRPTTRGQMATFIARTFVAAGAPLPGGADAFDDDDGSAHESAIDALAAAGIVTGLPDGRYGPDQPVTRAQMATFLTRTAEALLGEELPATRDAFDDDTGSVHEDAIDKMAHAGVAGGRGGGSYAPGDPTRRDQMTSFLTRLLDLLLEHGAANLPAS